MSLDLDRFMVSLIASTLLWSVVSVGGMLGLWRAGASLRRLGGLFLLAGFVVVAGLVSWHSRVHQAPNSQAAPPSVRTIRPPARAATTQLFVENIRSPLAKPDLAPAGINWTLPYDWRSSVRVFGLVWLCGGSGLIMVCLLEMLWLFRIRRTGRRILPQNAHPVFESALCRGPFCAGLFRPCMILPLGFAAPMERRELAGVLAHEEAHIRHGDIWLAHLQAVVCALIWWNPLVWVLARWLNRACEEVCDQVVVGAGADRELYAGSLVKAARLASTSTWRLAPGASSDFARLKKRVELILRTEVTQQPSGWRRVLLGMPALIVATWLGINAPTIGFGGEPAARQDGISAPARQEPTALPPAPEATIPALDAAVPASIPVVLIDPGHGGRDPGATTAHATEKDVVLKLSHRVSELLRESGVGVEMTRTVDTNMTLEARLALAQKLQPTLFLSIHANENSNSGKAHGLSVIEATNTGLGTTFATALAGVVNESVEVAIRPFRILRSPTCPALLLEAGYLSNVQDAMRLNDDGEREVLARAVAQAVTVTLKGGRNAPGTIFQPSGSPVASPSAPVIHSSPREKNPSLLADGFDFPVGAPDAEGYYKWR